MNHIDVETSILICPTMSTLLAFLSNDKVELVWMKRHGDN